MSHQENFVFSFLNGMVSQAGNPNESVMALRIGSSGRGKVLLVDDAFVFKKNRSRGQHTYWKCAHTGCNVRIRSNVFDLNDPQPVIMLQNPHNAAAHPHPADHDKVSRITAVTAMQNEIRADPSREVRGVYDQVVAAQHRRAAQNAAANPPVVPVVPNYDSIRSSLNRTRAAVVPPAPDHIMNVHLPLEWQQTWRGELYCLHQVIYNF